MSGSPAAQASRRVLPMLQTLPALPLPEGIRARIVDNHNGLQVHLLEAGHERAGAPTLLLLHGFPELAYSWRSVMLPLAQAGYHVIAPDQRGYGRTTGWSADYDADLAPFRLFNLVHDALGLLAALGLRSVAAVVGHDFGSPVAANCALVRPDMFRAVALMSAPYAGPPALTFGTAGPPALPFGTAGPPALPFETAGPPALPFDTANTAAVAPWNDASPEPDLHAALAALPRPRKHYQWHYATRGAEAEMLGCPQGLHAFLRAYYHHKSADWSGNRPFALAERSAAEFAKLPDYYVMDLGKGMAETVAPQMPSAAQIDACAWLPEAELAVYAAEFARTGLQGGLNWYRCATDGHSNADLAVFSGRRIEVPAVFIAGRSDWGAWQSPGALQAMRDTACAQFRGEHFIDGAGHWVQQEQPREVVRLLTDFLAGNV
jgi:pimeloyl-ACP methyl ester carboxylesterase